MMLKITRFKNLIFFIDPSCRLTSETGSSGKLAKDELNLLAKLIGTADTQNQETFRINLFDPYFEDDEAEK